MMQNMKPEEIDSYVKNMVQKIIPGNMGSFPNTADMFRQQETGVPPTNSTGTETIDAAAFETHDFVFIRISIKEDKWIKDLRLYHTSNKLIIENIPSPDDKHTITLPAIVKKKGAVADFRDGILEIRIPRNIDMQFSQIDVSE